MQPQFSMQQMEAMMMSGAKPDEGLNVTFYEGSKRDDKASDTAGREVFVPVVMVRILIPGNKDEIIDTEAWLGDVNGEGHYHNKRFPFAWARFQSQEKAGVTGFPIKEWQGINRSVADTLLGINISTVEQLADLSDGNLKNIPLPSPVELRQKAKDFLAQASSGPVLAAKLAELEAELAALRKGPTEPKLTVFPGVATAALLGVQPEPQEATESAPPVRRRGRPPKKAEAES